MRYLLLFIALLPVGVMAQTVAPYLDSIRQTMRDDPDRVGYYVGEVLRVDSLQQAVHQRELADIVITLDSLQARAELEKTLRERSELQAEDSRQSNVLYGSIMFGGLAAIIILLLVDRQRRQNQHEAEVQRLKDLTESLNATHQRLFNILSRDLAAPTQAFTNLVRSLNSSPERDNPEYLERLRDQGQLVVQELHGAMEWIFLQTGQAVLHRERFIAALWAREAVENCRAGWEERNQKVELLVPEGITVYGDRATLLIALENVMMELVFHTPTQQVLTVFAGNRDELVTLGVTSHSCNRPVSDFSLKSVDHNKLWLADEMVRRNAGKVTVEPATGGGLSIIFTLPR